METFKRVFSFTVACLEVLLEDLSRGGSYDHMASCDVEFVGRDGPQIEMGLDLTR